MKRVSLVVPMYNAANYIARCITSVMKQSVQDFELILIDDGSCDNTRQICEEFAAKDERIKYYYQDNAGVSAARNYGIRMCNTPYIMFVDADDLIKEYLVEKLVADMEHSDFAMCGYEIFDDISQTLVSTHTCPAFFGNISDFIQVIERYLFPPYLLSPWLKMFRTDIIRENKIEFPCDLSYGEDAIFVLCYLWHATSVRCREYVGYRYVRHGDETLSTKFREEKIDINIKINNLILQLFTRHGVENKNAVYEKRNLYVFASYAKELMLSDLTYRGKKSLFYQKAEKYYKKCGHAQGVPIRLVSFCAQHEHMFFLLYIFCVINRIKKLRSALK